MRKLRLEKNGDEYLGGKKNLITNRLITIGWFSIVDIKEYAKSSIFTVGRERGGERVMILS